MPVLQSVPAAAVIIPVLAKSSQRMQSKPHMCNVILLCNHHRPALIAMLLPFDTALGVPHPFWVPTRKLYLGS